MSDLPAYTVRLSRKAKRLQARIVASRLEVVVPAHKTVSELSIRRFLREKRAWITRHLTLPENKMLAVNAEVVFPEHIDLLALKQSFKVHYVHTGHKLFKAHDVMSGLLIVHGDPLQKIRVFMALRMWLHEKAVHYLERLLHELALQFHLPFTALRVRLMRTRWGSCSSEKHISLSSSLLFVPDHLVRYVLLHELCHTKHMNHGKTFWRLLMQLDPHAKKHIQELKELQASLPLWLWEG